MATNFTTEPLINYQGQNLDFASICQALEQIGVKAGDDICVHSSLMRLGKILVTPKQLLDTLIAAFREVIGPQGTLIILKVSKRVIGNKFSLSATTQY